MKNAKKSSQKMSWRSRIIYFLAYATVYLILNLIMQFIVSAIVQLAESRALHSLEFRNYLLVALNMLITASLYSGVLSNLEDGLGKISLKFIAIFHKFSRTFIGVIGSLALIYYLLFVAYYWNIFGQNILPNFVVQSWQSLAYYFDTYVIQLLQGWFGSK